MDRLTKEQRHRNMKRIKAKDTSIEVKFRKALWDKGYRYRKNVVELPGKPDIVIAKYHLAIFCDSEFFHGKDWNDLQAQLRRGNNPDFWIKKISGNIEHDSAVDKELKALGWDVLRFWGRDILHDVDGCVKAVEERIFDIKMSNID